MFGRATIRLGIGPHSSIINVLIQLHRIPTNITYVLTLQSRMTKVQRTWMQQRRGEMTEQDLMRLLTGLCASHSDYDTECMH